MKDETRQWYLDRVDAVRAGDVGATAYLCEVLVNRVAMLEMRLHAKESEVFGLEARLSRFERGVELAKEAPVWPAEPRVLVKNGKPVEHERNTQVAEPLRAVVNGLALPF